MKVSLFGEHSKNIADLVINLGHKIVEDNPDVIISYGGDGTLLSSERQYPGIPKLPIRDSQFCNKCPNHQDNVLLKKLADNKLQLKVYRKLHTHFLGKDLFALNDFVIRNSQPTHAIRFKTSATDDRLLIGDGIVLATPFGSTAYFKSITRKAFDQGLPAGRQGFGLAFNNLTERIEPVIFDEKGEVKFQHVRGNAQLSFDNNPQIFDIPEGAVITFKLSDQVAKIYEDTSLRCPNCEVIRG